MANYLEHRTKQGERWDLLAHQYYGDAHKMGLIVDANPQLAIVPTLPAGIIILIPVIEGMKAINNEKLPPWMR